MSQLTQCADAQPPNRFISLPMLMRKRGSVKMTPTVNCSFCRRNSAARASVSLSSSTTSKPRSRILSTMVSSLRVDPSKITAAYSVARLTSAARMPSIFLRCRVMVLAQLSQCIPVIGRLIWCSIFIPNGWVNLFPATRWLRWIK